MCTSTGRICDGYEVTPDKRTRAFRKSRRTGKNTTLLVGEDKVERPKEETKDTEEKQQVEVKQEKHICAIHTSDDPSTNTRTLLFPANKSRTGEHNTISSPLIKKRSDSDGSSQSSQSEILSSAILLADPHKASLTQRERWHYDFFFRRTSSQCSVYYGSEFWQLILPQFTEAEPALRHAVIALGALNRNFEESQVNPEAPDYSFPVQQCNRAIANLRRRLDADSSRHIETALITCIIFVSFAFLQGDTPAACRLLYGGEKLMKNWKQDPKPHYNHSGLKSTLTRVFFRIQIHAMTCADPEMFGEFEYSPNKLVSVLSLSRGLSEPFDSIETASSLLFSIGWESLQRRRLPPSMPGHETYTILSKLQNWEAQCHTSIIGRGNYVSPTEFSSLTMLRIWSETMYILAATDWIADRRESRFDAFLPHFRRCFGYAKKLLETNSYRSIMPTFYIGPGIIPPIFWSIYKCRDWELRKQALSLLRSWPCQEGFWNSAGAARCLEKVIEVETEGLSPGEVIPESQRIIATHVEYLQKTNTYRFWYRRSDALGNSEWENDILSA